MIPEGSIAARTKRLLDVVGALLGLLAAAPLLGFAAASVRLADSGPMLYADLRDGHGGQMIRVWKLRTMILDGDAVLRDHLLASPAARQEWETYSRLAEDPRVLGRVGRTLRRFSIDELPQLWNVLIGDMSLVGPRPLPQSALETLAPEFVELRRTVRPGMTGLWQVSGRSNQQMSELIRMDTQYVEHASLALDFRILARTPAIVLSGLGAY
jgi:lipopolysaccharide/colanic/teichoic acid biosynthesis glycosyltransferase